MANKTLRITLDRPARVTVFPVLPPGGGDRLDPPQAHQIQAPRGASDLSWEDEGWPNWGAEVLVDGGAPQAVVPADAAGIATAVTRSYERAATRANLVGSGGGGGGGGAYDDTEIKRRLSAVESGKADVAALGRMVSRDNADQLYAPKVLTQSMVSDNSRGITGLKQQVKDLEARPVLVVLGPDDPVPPGTPSGAVIIRKAE